MRINELIATMKPELPEHIEHLTTQYNIDTATLIEATLFDVALNHIQAAQPRTGVIR